MLSLAYLPYSPFLRIVSMPFCVLLSMSCFCLLATWPLYHQFTKRSNAEVKARTILQAMLTVLTPTHSVWPSTYPTLAYRAAHSSTGNCIVLRLPLKMLYYDILGGLVELRNPREQLSVLLAESLTTVSGLAVRLESDYYWWFKLLCWIVSCDLSANVQQCGIPRISSQVLSKVANPNYTRPLDHPPIQVSVPPSLLFLDTLHDDIPTLSLDCVPYRHLESYIRDLQFALAPGALLVLGLTSRPANSSFWSSKTIFTALPFFPRHSVGLTAQQQPHSPRTITPLFASVLSVLQLLTAGPNPLTVEVARNVSREYAQYLHCTVDRLEHDLDARTKFVRQWGMQAWIEERLHTGWEAALMDVGLLEGWAIVVSKPE